MTQREEKAVVHALSILLAISTWCLIGCAFGPGHGGPPLQVVPYVDLGRYVGTWYEIARYPHSFQKGCVATTATYTLRSDGDIDVLNQCRLATLDGEMSSAAGKAKVTDRATNAKLKVTFFWPFYGDYWIIDLDEAYTFAVVGHPSRDYLWVLSRSPHMDDEVYRGILQRLEKQSYDTGRLMKTAQPRHGAWMK